MMNFFFSGHFTKSFIAEHIKETNRYLNICRKEYILECLWFQEIKACSAQIYYVSVVPSSKPWAYVMIFPELKMAISLNPGT